MFEHKRIALPSSPVLSPKSRPQYYREGLCVLVAIAILGQIFLLTRLYPFDIVPWLHTDHAANSTLGFGSIYAVSRKGSPRRQSLLSAATLTDLEIVIPTQPSWTDEDIERIQAPVNSTVDRGSALAWLGHRNALEKFLRSSEETALIIEDDVDWDTRLRTQQIPQTAYAIRELLGSHQGYYGDTEKWDIIWLGHCGDYFNATRGSNLSMIKSFKDPAMPPLDDLHPWTRDFMYEIGADQNQQRLVHQSVRPLCTFAYAITRRAAQRVLHELAVKEPIRSLEHPCKAYDVRLLESCRDEGMQCISVNPELFHHSNVESEIAQISESRPVVEADSPPESSTTNIQCSARSRKWKEIQDSITDPSVNPELFVRDLAQRSPRCEIDHI